MDFKSLLADFKQSTAKQKTKPTTPDILTTNNITKRKSTTPIETIYIICPPPHKVTTGGPEALHQLCDMINTFTILQSYMLYINPPYTFLPTSTSSTAYKHYNAPFATITSPEENSLCIWPECWTKYAKNAFDTRVAIWWLSVNNNDGFQDWDDETILHLYQSEYAKQHLTKHVKRKENIIGLFEYIPMYETPTGAREMDIVYNPKKGMHYTDQIINHLSNKYNIQPIGYPTPLTSAEVREFLSNSKIYIDFGPHPGMDRLPREAALCGCLVITNSEGAAANSKDVPIPSGYKLKEFDVERACALLRKSLEEYEERKKDFDGYREWIHGQYDGMKDCILDFVDVLKDGNKKRKIDDVQE